MDEVKLIGPAPAINVALLSRILPRAPVAWLHELAAQMPVWGIDTPNEMASFVAQLAHESAELTRLEEGLRYSAQRLPQVWKRFAENPADLPALRRPNALAFKYANDPVALANFVYADRLGNGDEASGDGWRYHGRGPIQMTGRANYQACAGGINEPDLVQFPELLCTPRAGIRSACWYWMAKDLDILDDDDDVLAETRVVNGGEHGRVERQAYFSRALLILREVPA